MQTPNAMSSSTYDVIVVGVGGMGSATAFELARRERSVLGLERFDIPHDRGSSHGHTRIIRLAYYEDSSYVPLLRRAYEHWRSLETRVGEKLLHVTGSVDAGPPDSEVFRGSLRSCEEHGLSHEVLTSEELTERFPGYQLPTSYRALYQEDGGFLRSERCIVGFVRAAQDLGARIQARERVLDWEVSSGSVRVDTDRGQYQAQALVVTAGAWSAQLLPIRSDHAVPERQVLAWFQPKEPDRFSPDRFPVFNLSVVPDDSERYYGFPVHGIPGFKIGRYHHFGESVDPDQLGRDIYEPDERVLREATDRFFPSASGPTMTLTTCLFTNSRDKHPVIGMHPAHSNVCFAAGFSGHGFKFCSVMGEILADLATDGTTDLPIHAFRPDRFDNFWKGQ